MVINKSERGRPSELFVGKWIKRIVDISYSRRLRREITEIYNDDKKKKKTETIR